MFDSVTLAMIHKKMEMALANVGAHISALEYCPDHPNKASSNRKPNTGMVDKILDMFDADPKETWLVGDSISDLKCAQSASCKGVLVLTGNGKKTLSHASLCKDIPVFENLDAFVNKLLSIN
jgi:D-glycero-D-manno-heptose 1,7-bisphosphate phosphatase